MFKPLFSLSKICSLTGFSGAGAPSNELAIGSKASGAAIPTGAEAPSKGASSVIISVVAIRFSSVVNTVPAAKSTISSPSGAMLFETALSDMTLFEASSFTFSETELSSMLLSIITSVSLVRVSSETFSPSAVLSDGASFAAAPSETVLSEVFSPSEVSLSVVSSVALPSVSVSETSFETELSVTDSSLVLSELSSSEAETSAELS